MSEKNDEDESGEAKKGAQRKIWEDLFFSAVDKIATAPQRLKDPKESVAAALDWVKTIRDDVQAKVTTEIAEKISQIDWDSLGKKTAEHIAQNFDLEVQTKISFKPKRAPSSDESKKEE